MTKKPLNPLLRRQKALAVVRHRFEGRPLDWGRSDCAKLVGAMIRQMGLDPRLDLAGRYSSALGAYQALRNHGLEDVDGWLDQVEGLSRTPFARVLPGDILAFPGEGGKLGLALSLGRGQAFYFAATAPHAARAHTLFMPPVACWSVC